MHNALKDFAHVRHEGDKPIVPWASFVSLLVYGPCHIFSPLRGAELVGKNQVEEVKEAVARLVSEVSQEFPFEAVSAHRLVIRRFVECRIQLLSLDRDVERVVLGFGLGSLLGVSLGVAKYFVRELLRFAPGVGADIRLVVGIGEGEELTQHVLQSGVRYSAFMQVDRTELVLHFRREISQVRLVVWIISA